MKRLEGHKEDELMFTRPVAGRAARHREGISHPWAMTAFPVTASAAETMVTELGWLSHTPGMMPTGSVYGQVWKSQQPDSSPFQIGQGTDAE